MLDGTQQDNFFGLPGLMGIENIRESAKIPHDEYRVFVNKDFIGNKVLLAQNEQPGDLEKYLRNKGFEKFTTKLTGNEYVITPNKDDSNDMKNALQVYLRNR